MNWLPDMDLNHDKEIQSLLCYRYTIGQTRLENLEIFAGESRFDDEKLQKSFPNGKMAIAK